MYIIYFVATVLLLAGVAFSQILAPPPISYRDRDSITNTARDLDDADYLPAENFMPRDAVPPTAAGRGGGYQGTTAAPVPPAMGKRGLPRDVNPPVGAGRGGYQGTPVPTTMAKRGIPRDVNPPVGAGRGGYQAATATQ